MINPFKFKIFLFSSLLILSLTMKTAYLMEHQEDQSQISKLPDEVQVKILEGLDPKALAQMSETCQKFHDLAQDEYLWERLCKNEGFIKGRNETWKQTYAHYMKLPIALKKLRKALDKASFMPSKVVAKIYQIREEIDRGASVHAVYREVRHLEKLTKTELCSGTHIDFLFRDGRMMGLLQAPRQFEKYGVPREEVDKMSRGDMALIAYEKNIPILMGKGRTPVTIQKDDPVIQQLRDEREYTYGIHAFMLVYEKEN